MFRDLSDDRQAHVFRVPSRTHLILLFGGLVLTLCCFPASYEIFVPEYLGLRL